MTTKAIWEAYNSGTLEVTEDAVAYMISLAYSKECNSIEIPGPEMAVLQAAWTEKHSQNIGTCDDTKAFKRWWYKGMGVPDDVEVREIHFSQADILALADKYDTSKWNRS